MKKDQLREDIEFAVKLAAQLALDENTLPRAEYWAEQAVIIASQDEKRYATSLEAIQVYEKTEPKPTKEPSSVKEAREFIAKTKGEVNEIANELMVTDLNFRRDREEFIYAHLQKNSPLAKPIKLDGHVQYRSIRVNGSYGTPENTFAQGMAPQFLSMWKFQKGIISVPYVNDSTKVTPKDMEKVGWTGGIVSTSSNLKFSAAFDFAAKYGQQDGYIYAVAVKKAVPVSTAVHKGVGYSGLGGKSNAQAGEEYMLPFVHPEEVVGVLKVSKNGELSELKINTKCKTSAFGDTEYLKFMYIKNVADLALLEKSSALDFAAKDPNISKNIGKHLDLLGLTRENRTKAEAKGLVQFLEAYCENYKQNHRDFFHDSMPDSLEAFNTKYKDAKKKSAIDPSAPLSLESEPRKRFKLPSEDDTSLNLLADRKIRDLDLTGQIQLLSQLEIQIEKFDSRKDTLSDEEKTEFKQVLKTYQGISAQIQSLSHKVYEDKFPAPPVTTKPESVPLKEEKSTAPPLDIDTSKSVLDETRSTLDSTRSTLDTRKSLLAPNMRLFSLQKPQSPAATSAPTSTLPDTSENSISNSH